MPIAHNNYCSQDYRLSWVAMACSPILCCTVYADFHYARTFRYNCVGEGRGFANYKVCL